MFDEYPILSEENAFDLPTYQYRITHGDTYGHDLCGFKEYCYEAEITRILAFVDDLPSGFCTDYANCGITFAELWNCYVEDQSRYIDWPQFPYVFNRGNTDKIGGRTYSEWLQNVLADEFTAHFVGCCEDDELAADFNTLAHAPDDADDAPEALEVLFRILWEDDATYLRTDVEHYLDAATLRKAREASQQN